MLRDVWHNHDIIQLCKQRPARNGRDRHPISVRSGRALIPRSRIFLLSVPYVIDKDELAEIVQSGIIRAAFVDFVISFDASSITDADRSNHKAEIVIFLRQASVAEPMFC